MSRALPLVPYTDAEVRTKPHASTQETVYHKLDLMYNLSMTNKYTLKKSYGTTHTGREVVLWDVMDGDHTVDTFSLRRDAKYYMDLWNAAK